MSTTKVRTITHTAIANNFINRRGDRTMFTRGNWYEYGDGYWQVRDELGMEREIWTLLEEFESRGEVKPSDSVHRSVTKCIRAKMFINEREVDAYSTLVNLRNGMYSLEDNQLFPHDPSRRLTTQLPFSYDPAAQAPMWQMYLGTTFVHPKDEKGKFQRDVELIEFVQEAMGYSLTSDVSHHVTFWCFGGGSNGKGVLFHILEKLAGNTFFPLNVGLLKRNPYQLAELAGKRIAACSESSASNNLVDDAQVKALVSGDTMLARSPHQRPFILHPKVKLWWSMNELPAVADSSEGFWRRMRVIPFHRQFSGNDCILDLKEQLDKELPGIFNWAMAGLRRLRQRGHFFIPQQVATITAEYRFESNPVALFVDDQCTIDPHADVKSSDLYASYRNWCSNNGYHYMNTRNFKRRMIQLGFGHEKTRAHNAYTGLRVNVILP